jgi:acetolactate synthase-1/2/3 large subunit
MNGAESILGTLAASGVEVCFANPGTTELPIVAALDKVPQVRGVLGLFEGVVTGAADGYGRVAGKPAATLLHLGPGLADGIANLHNAKVAQTPVVNIVGEHATGHQRLEPFPLSTGQLAGTVSGWARAAARSESLPRDVADAVAASAGPPGCVATLFVPADLAWSPAPGPAPAAAPRAARTVSAEAVARVAGALSSGGPAAIVLGTAAARERSLNAASRVAQATGSRLYLATFPAVIDRGEGLPAVDRLGYPTEAMAAQLAGIRHLVLVGTHPPVSFFAAPGRASSPVPQDCAVHWLAAADEDAPAALEHLADAVGAPPGAPGQPPGRPARPAGALTPATFAAAVGALLPDRAILVDESLTCGFGVPAATRGAPRHEWLCGTGLAIGQGLPVATGAAIAAPDRKVICLEADGSAMYTIQALWTQAREGLDVTTVICANQAYGVLRMDLAATGAGPAGRVSARLLDLSGPALDFTLLARSMGVPATRATTAEELVTQLERAIAEPGPRVVEAMFTAPPGH